jgi:hypothetical protein
MKNPEDFKNNPLYTDITKLDHLSPSPNFDYRWSVESGRWEPATDVLELDMDATNNILIGISGAIQNFTGVLNDIHIGVDLEHDQETHKLLSGISGSLGHNNDGETHRLLSGISGALGNNNDIETHKLLSGISGSLGNNNDGETHRLLSGISGALGNNNDIETHRLLSGLSEELSNIHIGVDLDHDTETHRLLSGLSGELSNIHIGVDLDHDTETHRLLSGLSGELSNIHIGVDLDHDTETHRLLSGISGGLADIHIGVDFDHDVQTHELLSGISRQLSGIRKGVDLDHDGETHRLLNAVIGKLDNVGGTLNVCENGIPRSRQLSQQWKLKTKTVNQKIEEDFILLENIPDHHRYGYSTGQNYGTDRSLFDDIYGTYFNNGRMNANTPEEFHPDYFIHAEYTDPNRGVDKTEYFHTDTMFGIRQENVGASLTNSYELEDFNEMYKRGLLDHVTIFNHSPYPIQFHTAKNRRYDNREPVSPLNKDIIYLESDMAVKIQNDEAGGIFIKRPHTISGFTVTYSLTYKDTGVYDVVPTNNFNLWEIEKPQKSNSHKDSMLPVEELPEDPNSEFSVWETKGNYLIPIHGEPPFDTDFSLWKIEGDTMKAK